MLTHRKDKTELRLDKDFVQTLNLYFGNLSYDDHYMKPTTMEIDYVALAPTLTRTQVFYILAKIKELPPQDQIGFLFGCGNTLLPYFHLSLG